MFDQLARLNSDHLTFLGIMTGLVLAALTLIVGTLIVQIRQFRQRQLELGFREEMLRRGYSSHEIVQLLSTRRPTFIESAAGLAVRVKEKLAAATRRFAKWMPQSLQRSRQWLHPLWTGCRTLCRKAWRAARPFCRDVWESVRPLVRQTRTAISRCVGGLSDRLDNLARRLTPHGQ